MELFASSNLETLLQQIVAIEGDSPAFDPESLNIATSEMNDAESILKANVSELGRGTNPEIIAPKLDDARKQVALARAKVLQLELSKIKIHPTTAHLRTRLTDLALKVNSLSQNAHGPGEFNLLYKELGVELTYDSPARSVVLSVSSVRATYTFTW